MQPASRRVPPVGLPSLETKLGFLIQAATYPGLKQPPRCVQTHMSWLIFVGGQVLKLKKPVRFPFLDFTTLQAREHFCREELRLNARLAPDVYRGLLKLCAGAAGLSLRTESQAVLAGRPVEWLVWMRRLPTRRNLRRLITHSTLAAADVAALAQVLAGFYRTATPIRIDPSEVQTRMFREQAANREVLLRPQFHLREVSRTLARLEQAMKEATDLLCARVSEGGLVDGHGDLRPEHVYLLDPPVIIDCLEFSAELRQVDPYDEIAFLGLECAMAGAPWVGEHLALACAAEIGESLPPARLIKLYTARRAVLRARLAMAHLLDPVPCSPRRWPALAQRYLDAAAATLARRETARPTFNAAMNRGRL